MFIIQTFVKTMLGVKIEGENTTFLFQRIPDRYILVYTDYTNSLYQGFKILDF